MTSTQPPIVICPSCGAKNRIGAARAKRGRPICGRCGAALPTPNAARGEHAAPAKPIIVTDATFSRDVLGADRGVVLVDFWAAWCGPCRMLAPALESLASEANSRYVIAKLNIDENPRIAARFRVSSIPTMIIFRNGEIANQLVGLASKSEIAAALRKVI